MVLYLLVFADQAEVATASDTIDHHQWLYK
jgi:hypothetical protein